MPFAFLFVGIVMLISGIRGTSSDLVTLVKGDLTGQKNFTYWILSIVAIGSLGYIPSLQKFSRAFLGLVIVVLVLADNKDSATGGFFVEFQSAIQSIIGG